MSAIPQSLPAPAHVIVVSACPHCVYSQNRISALIPEAEFKQDTDALDVISLELDAAMESRAISASAGGCALAYVCGVNSAGIATVSVVALSEEDPLYTSARRGKPVQAAVVYSGGCEEPLLLSRVGTPCVAKSLCGQLATVASLLM